MSTEADDQVEEYKPTRAEQRLLEILLDPERRFLTITKICELAKCDRSVYYRAFEKEDFEELYRRESRALTVRALAPVINSVVNEAVRGSHQHAKIVLAMAGEYSERQDLALIGKDGEPQDVGGVVFYIPSNGRDQGGDDGAEG